MTLLFFKPNYCPKGYRTPPINYPKGCCKKQVGRLFATDNKKPILLLVSDSNGRNIVQTQIVMPSSKCKFNLSGMSIPGGTDSHGAMEIKNGVRFSNISYVLLPLGTNDILNCKRDFNESFESEAAELLMTCKECYPEAKTFVSAVLPQKESHSKRVSQANIILEKLAGIFELPFVKLQIPRDSHYWSDNIHLSDLGLRVFMHSMENSIHRLLNTFCI